MTKCCKSECSKEGTVTVSRLFKTGGTLIMEEDTQEPLSLPLIRDDVPVATISADRSLTKNLGNFNSIRVGVFCSVPCYLDPKEIQAAQDFCVKTCEDRIEKDCQEFYEFLVQQYPDIFKKI